MLIVCPTCASRYSIDDEKIGPNGKTVRCASCRTDFFASPATLSVPQPDGEHEQVSQESASRTVMPPGDEELAKGWLDAESQDSAAMAQPSQKRDVPQDLDQGEMDALFAQEMAAAEKEAEALTLPPDAMTPALGWRRFLPAWPSKRMPESAVQTMATSSLHHQTGPQLSPKPGAAPRGKTSAGAGRRQGVSGAGLVARILRSTKGPAGAGLAGAMLVAALILQRDTTVRVVPSSAVLFAMIGLPVNLQGLAFSDVRSVVLSEGSARFLVVDGAVKNVRAQTVPVPLIDITIRGQDGRAVYTWTTEPPRSNLKAGEALQFRARLATPPESGRDVEVSFSEKPGQTLAQR